MSTSNWLAHFSPNIHYWISILQLFRIPMVQLFKIISQLFKINPGFQDNESRFSSSNPSYHISSSHALVLHCNIIIFNQSYFLHIITKYLKFLSINRNRKQINRYIVSEYKPSLRQVFRGKSRFCSVSSATALRLAYRSKWNDLL